MLEDVHANRKFVSYIVVVCTHPTILKECSRLWRGPKMYTALNSELALLNIGLDEYPTLYKILTGHILYAAIENLPLPLA